MKDIRDDNQSASNLNTYNSYWSSQSGSFDFAVNPRMYSDQNAFKKFGQPGDLYYQEDNTPIQLPSISPTTGRTLLDWQGQKTVLKYVDIPTSSSLKLEKILLLKNEDVSFSKNQGNLTQVLDGTVYLNDFISNAQSRELGSSARTFLNFDVFSKPNVISNFQSNLHTNVLDVSDISGSDLQSKSIKVIDFSYDALYPLAKSTPNSVALSKGRLTLNAVCSQGKGGVALIPPYKFEYAKPYVEYDKSLEDVWGYHKDDADAWSLNKIITPQGSSINIVYESDKYKPASDMPLRFSMDPRPNDDTDGTTGRLLTLPDSNGDFFIDAREYFGMQIDDTFDVNYFYYANNPCQPLTGCDPLNDGASFNETARIIQVEDGTKFLARLTGGGVNHNAGNRHLRSLNATYAIQRNLSGIDDNYVGGGIRVKQIDVKEGTQTIHRTDYEYEGGVSSYIPLDDYQVSYASEIIPPGVLYEFSTAKSINQDGDLIQKTKYEFEVPTIGEPLIEVEKDTDYYFATTNTSTTAAVKTTFHDKSAYIGRLKSVSHYNPKGYLANDGHLLQRTVHDYKDDHTADGSFGMRQESFKSYKKKTYPEQFDGARNTTWDVRATSFVKYPNILAGKSIVENNQTKTTYYDGFDYLTGQVISTRYTDSKGRSLKSETRPAYHKFVGMGAKVDGLTNNNMLTQKRMDLLSISEDGINYNPIGTAISTWKQWENNIWRSHESYRWIGQKATDGKFLNFDVSNDDGFVWSDPSNSPANKWEKTSEVTKYNSYSRAIEVMDINGNKASTKMGDNESQVFAVANASNNEMFYSGAEDLEGNSFSGGVSKGTATPTPDSHTGESALVVGSGQTAFEVSVVNSDPEEKSFRISLWVKFDLNNYQNTRVIVGGEEVQFSPEEVIRAGDWVLLNFYTSSFVGDKQIHVTSNTSSIIVDDFRVHPVHSTMTSYVYNSWDELTHILGPNNMAVEYRYDDMGRLIETLNEVQDYTIEGSGGFKRKSENAYTYKY